MQELAQGGDLFSLMDGQGVFDEPQSAFYAASVTLALQHVHQRGFIYRDLKPENLLLDARGNLKLGDFGLARKAERLWTIIGTPEYTAPEVLRFEGATRAVDWWQLGVLIYEMLTGRLPYESADEVQLFAKIREAHFVWPPSCDNSKRISHDAKSLVAGLLRLAVERDVPTPTAGPESPMAVWRCVSGMVRRPHDVRLGCGGRDAEEVMEHEWFGDMDWHALAVGKLPTPFVPRLQSPTDDSYFGPRERRGTPLKLSRREDCFSC